MKNNVLTNQAFQEIIEIARYSPSVHNSQPWRVKRDVSGISVHVDKKHTLSSGDPTHRQTTISLGIFVESIIIAAKYLGFHTKNIHFHDQSAQLEFESTTNINKESVNEAKLIKTRCSDRSIFKKIAVSNHAKKTITGSWHSHNIKIWTIDSPPFIDKVAELTSKGISLALSNPEFRNELSNYLVRPWSNKNRGISVKSLYIPFLLSILQPELLKLGLSTKKEANLEKKRWLSSSCIVFITSKGDLHNDWFEVGRAYQKTSLAIEKLGLSQATSAAIVEASSFHEDVEQALDTDQRLQAVIRIGGSTKKRMYSPRASVQELTLI